MCLGGKEDFALILYREGRAAFGGAALPDLDLQNALGRPAAVAELNLQGKRLAKLKHAAETDTRLDENIGVGRREPKPDDKDHR